MCLGCILHCQMHETCWLALGWGSAGGLSAFTAALLWGPWPWLLLGPWQPPRGPLRFPALVKAFKALNGLSYLPGPRGWAPHLACSWCVPAGRWPRWWVTRRRQGWSRSPSSGSGEHLTPLQLAAPSTGQRPDVSTDASRRLMESGLLSVLLASASCVLCPEGCICTAGAVLPVQPPRAPCALSAGCVLPAHTPSLKRSRSAVCPSAWPRPLFIAQSSLCPQVRPQYRVQPAEQDHLQLLPLPLDGVGGARGGGPGLLHHRLPAGPEEDVLWQGKCCHRRRAGQSRVAGGCCAGRCGSSRLLPGATDDGKTCSVLCRLVVHAVSVRGLKESCLCCTLAVSRPALCRVAGCCAGFSASLHSKPGQGGLRSPAQRLPSCPSLNLHPVAVIIRAALGVVCPLCCSLELKVSTVTSSAALHQNLSTGLRSIVSFRRCCLLSARRILIIRCLTTWRRPKTTLLHFCYRCVLASKFAVPQATR